MNRLASIIIGLLLLTGVLTLVFVHRSFAQSCDNTDECNQLIKEYEQKLTSLRQQKNTLSAEIEFANTQIYLTELRVRETENKIIQTEQEIENLGGRIETLNTSLDHLTRVLLNKIVEGYKNREDLTFIHVLLDEDNARSLAAKLKYMQTSQENDSRIAFRIQQAKLNFEQQRDLREEKKAELDSLKVTLDQQKVNLDGQRTSKAKLLAITQNDEVVYQNLLARARAEYAAIQGIVAGAGTEEQMREVKKGDSIASVIGGSSCNSSGTHLHFTVLDGGSAINPFSKLRDADHIDYSGGDPWNPSGDWDWPLSPRIEFNQGFGVTSCVQSGICGKIYSSHNGLDIYGAGSSVRAVADGTLYRGSYSVGCTLSYVKVVHKDSNISTLYLHVYPQ